MCDVFICSDDGVGFCDVDREILQALGRDDQSGPVTTASGSVTTSSVPVTTSMGPVTTSTVPVTTSTKNHDELKSKISDLNNNIDANVQDKNKDKPKVDKKGKIFSKEYTLSHLWSDN